MVAVAHQLDDLTIINTDGQIVPLFHEGQRRAAWSDARITLVLAGSQGGKTVIGPWWLLRQMRRYGPGDYIVAGPELTLLRRKVIPEVTRLFCETLRIGVHVGSPDNRLTISDRGERFLFGTTQRTKTTIWFGHGDDPDSLESMTAKAAWLDEAGQKKFKRESYEAIQRRLVLADGPTLITTTPYYLGWLKSELYDRRDDPTAGIAVINFPSIVNPQFDRKVWEQRRATLPAWKFNMFYRGRFERPAGLIYDCWNDDIASPESNVIPAFALPGDWPRFTGLDFGGVNTAGLFAAKELDSEGHATGRYIGYREYHAGGRTAEQHVRELLKGEPRTPTAIGGSKSEGQWRDEFAAGGLGVWPPVVTDVEVGIQRAYGMIKERRFVVFDTLTGFRDQMTSYSRELDEQGEPTERIEDKEAYHYLDAGRYLLSYLAMGLDGALMA